MSYDPRFVELARAMVAMADARAQLLGQPVLLGDGKFRIEDGRAVAELDVDGRKLHVWLEDGRLFFSTRLSGVLHVAVHDGHGAFEELQQVPLADPGMN